jgi:outer membrane protein insertion porin family
VTEAVSPTLQGLLPWKAATSVAAFVVLLAALAPVRAVAQQANRIVVDSIAVEGNERVAATTILGYVAFQVGDTIGAREVQETEKGLWSTGQFSDLRIFAEGTDAGEGHAVVRIAVEERALLRRLEIRGLENADPDLVRDSAGVREGAPYQPQQVIRGKEILRRRLADKGIPFASIEERLVAVEGLPNVVDLILEVEEGNRVTVAQVTVQGNERVSTSDIVGAMSTRPEGFWWFQGGSFDEDRFEADVLEGIPQLYRSRGFLDIEVLSDSLVLDPSTGKARIELVLDEGLQYRVTALSVTGNRHFSDERLEPLFLPERGGLLRTLGLGSGQREEEALGRVFDQVAFEAALQDIQQMYYNEGFIFAQVSPFIQKNPPPEDGQDPTVSVGVNIQEGQPAFLNRISIVGNDFTYERVIRDRIALLPGDVYSQDRVLQSYQGINALGFFETPLPFPDIEPDPETGEVDVTFYVKERQTGAINFGTSVGGGIGLAGFIGYDQPNLFGQAKEGHLRWDFGRYVNNFTVTFSDPALFQTRTSGTISLFNARDRFFSFNSGERRRVGASLRFGFPIPQARWTRMFAGYAISRTKYRLREGVDDRSLFGREPGLQSQVSLGLTRTTLNHPIFPTTGSRQSWNVEFNGGFLGGDGNFTRHLWDATWWLPIGQVGGGGGARGVTFALGTSMKAGAIFGDPDNFPFDRFWMGGVQFGQSLRGYDETSVTPFGFFPENSRSINDIDRLGNAFLTLTTELAMRLNDNISVSGFFDAGNVWRRPGEMDPSQLYRGAGMGLQLVTPFGPIGLDYAYGFDKAVPGWQLHFRMGPGF